MDDDRQHRLDALARAERYLRRRIGPDVEIQLDPHVHRTTGRRMAVHGQQQYRGLSLYPHSFVVHLDGRTTQLDGDPFVNVGTLDVQPSQGAAAAVAIAFGHLRAGAAQSCRTPHQPLFGRRRFRPRTTAVFPMPNQPSVFARGPFHEDVTANLIVHRNGDRLSLAWLVSTAVADVADFTIVLDAHTLDVLRCTAEAASAICFGDVVLYDPVEAAPALSRFPRLRDDYSPGIRPTAEFSEWVETNATQGNNVETAFDNVSRFVRAVQTANGLRFQPANAIETQLVNAFFLCNFLHDFFSLIGFGEADGNFQHRNVSGAGIAGDRLRVNVLPQAHGSANMRAQTDGKDAEMRLGRVRQGRAAALDAAIVIHEYAHGVSQRLVGGKKKKTGLTDPQSLAMGEGWSDYFAITLLNSYRPAARRLRVFAPWAFANAAGGRRAAYDSSFRAHFGMLGIPPHDEQHEAGSIFAAALLAMHDEMQRLLGDTSGNETAWKLVVAGKKELHANPTFLQGRDALLACIPGLGLSSGNAAAVEQIVRVAFAARGMGRAATSADSSFTGIRADFTA